MLTPSERYLATSDGVSICYTYQPGSGPCLVFVHGVGGHLMAWKHQLEAFQERGYATLALDLRGHGRSGRPSQPESYRLEAFAQDIFDVLAHERIRNPVLIGHSFGGMVTLQFHRMFPKAASKYVLINSAYKSPTSLSLVAGRPFVGHILKRFLAKQNVPGKHPEWDDERTFHGTADWDFSRLRNDITVTTLQSWAYTYRTIGLFDASDVLSTITQPLLILHGERDSVLSLETALHMGELAHQAEVRVIPGANHLIPLNNPYELEAALDSWVRGPRRVAAQPRALRTALGTS